MTLGVSLSKAQEDNLNKLSKENVKFLKYIEGKKEFFDLKYFKNLKFPVGTNMVSPWPTFISVEMLQEFKDVAFTLGDIIKDIPFKYMRGDIQKIADYYEVETNEVEFWLSSNLPDTLGDLVLRGDYILGSDGIKCIEMNGSAALGGWQIPFYEQMLLSNEVISEYLKNCNLGNENTNLAKAFFGHLLNCHIKKHDETLLSANIAIVSNHPTGIIDDQINYFNLQYKKLLVEKGLSSELGTIFFINYTDLSINNGLLYYKEFQLPILVELKTGISDDVAKLIFEKKLLVFNGDISNIIGNKLSMAYLSAGVEAGIFSEEIVEFIIKHVPWTRKVTDYNAVYLNENLPLKEIFIKYKNRMVIKSALDCSGVGVFVGQHCSDKDWRKAWETAISEKAWILQEIVEAVPLVNISRNNEYSQMNSVWGILTYGDVYGGSLLRMLPFSQKANSEIKGGVVNGGQGATVSVVFHTQE